MLKIVMRLYIVLLHLYPRAFRDEFGEEMQNVFADSIAEAARRGNIAIVQLLLKELCDLPGAVLRAHWQARSKSIMKSNSRTSRFELLVAAIPFLFFLIFAIMQAMQIDWAGAIVLLFVFMLPILLFLGLMKGMPRWSLPVLGLSLAILNYIQFGIVGIVFVGITATPPLFLREIFGSGLSYVGTAFLILVILLATALIKPLRPFFQRFREDCTLLSFALFGMLPLVIFIGFDEWQGRVPYEIGMGLVLLASLWLYLRMSQFGLKMFVLSVGMILAMMIEAVGKWILLPSQSWSGFEWHTIEQSQQSIINATFQMWFWIIVAVLLPAGIGLLLLRTRIDSATPST